MVQKRKIKKKREQSSKRYSFEFRLKIVRMYLEEQYPVPLICSETGVGKSTISTWVRKYRSFGEDGLRYKASESRRKSSVNKAVKTQIVDIKEAHPEYGSRRISDILKRFFFIKTSPSTVHKALSGKNLVEKKRPKPKRNPPKPRFFERSTPNQLWQSDICTFRLAGKNAYLIGFIDDYSRYIIGLELYRSQTATNVLEVYRRAVGEYNVPKEMLTDNGRQYVNWRGTTKFQHELKKDRVKHIRSRPHHPMTLGKIERFWKSILQEFLLRSQFNSFEDARQRITIWINYYNHRRPHQGIKGLCPADRYFEIQSTLKKTLAQGVEENALELALRGRPKDPFYMVGRMNGQNVVIRAEKGKLRMMVDGEDEGTSDRKELIYPIDNREQNNDNQTENESSADVQCRRKTQGGTAGLDGAKERSGDLQRDESQLDPAGSLAEPGNGGYVKSIGTEEERRTGTFEQPVGEAAGEETLRPWKRVVEAYGPLGITATETAACIELDDDQSHDNEETTVPGECWKTGGNHHESSCRSSECHRGGSSVGRVTEDLLQVGEPGTGGYARFFGEAENRPARNPGTRAEGNSVKVPDRRAGKAKDTSGEAAGAQGSGPPDQTRRGTAGKQIPVQEV